MSAWPDNGVRPSPCPGASDPGRRRALRGLVGAGLAGAAPWAPSAHAAAPGRGDRVTWPAGLPLLDGGRWRPAPGMATIVVFWSTTCPFCRRHNRHVEKLHQALRGRPARVLGAARDSDPAAVSRHLAQHGLSFPVTLAWRELAPRLSTRQMIPLTVTVDRDDRLQEVIPGEMFEADALGLAALAG
jgi:thiol-disulfide isomerase/thioredoxin